MQLEGLHHITAITADAPRNVDFYARVLGLRMVKKTVNFDSPDVYHLYYGDESGTPGSIVTFFEFPQAAPGVAGDGMVHTILLRLGSSAALDFWTGRLAGEGIDTEREPDRLRFADPEGLTLELVLDSSHDAPLIAAAADIPAEHAIRGFHGVRAYASAPQRSEVVLQSLGFTQRTDGTWVVGEGTARHAELAYDPPPPGTRRQEGAGSVHHIAWSAADDEELERLRTMAAGGGAHPTAIIDRQYFHSVYFREPSGVLFELASRDIGFAVDEPADRLGEQLLLPPQHEHLRSALEAVLTPISNPRATRTTA